MYMSIIYMIIALACCEGSDDVQLLQLLGSAYAWKLHDKISWAAYVSQRMQEKTMKYIDAPTRLLKLSCVCIDRTGCFASVVY